MSESVIVLVLSVGVSACVAALIVTVLVRRHARAIDRLVVEHILNHERSLRTLVNDAMAERRGSRAFPSEPDVPHRVTHIRAVGERSTTGEP